MTIAQALELITSELVAGVTAAVVGGVTLVNWWFVMFSDSWYGDFQRDLSKVWFNLGRNTGSLITPASGIMMLSGSGFLFLAEGGVESAWLLTCSGVIFILSMVFVVLGLFPFRLPGWMYPEWQLARRRRRAEEAARAAGVVERVGSGSEVSLSAGSEAQFKSRRLQSQGLFTETTWTCVLGMVVNCWGVRAAVSDGQGGGTDE